MTFLQGNGPRIIAHRGLSIRHVENTIGSFNAALAAGADILETDVHLSKDGVAIAAHDPDLKRLCGDDSRISDLTEKQLAAINLGSGEGLPSLRCLLEEFPDSRFNVDLKTPEVVGAFAEAVRSQNAEHRVLAASFNGLTRARAVELIPGIASSASRKMVLDARLKSLLGLPPTSWSIPPEIVAMQIPPFALGLALATPQMINFAHRKGVEVHIWTINKISEIKKLIMLGVDGIVTDRADLASEVMQDLNDVGNQSPDN